MVLSIGVFFSLMISGLAQALPQTLSAGLIAQGVPAADATRVAGLPPVAVLFAALLGYNPIQALLGPNALQQLPADHAAYLTGRSFFPALISPPFSRGLAIAFGFAVATCLVAAIASWLRGGKYVYAEPPEPVPPRPVSPPRQEKAAVPGPGPIERQAPETPRAVSE